MQVGSPWAPVLTHVQAGRGGGQQAPSCWRLSSDSTPCVDSSAACSPKVPRFCKSEELVPQCFLSPPLLPRPPWGHARWGRRGHHTLGAGPSPVPCLPVSIKGLPRGGPGKSLFPAPPVYHTWAGLPAQGKDQLFATRGKFPCPWNFPSWLWLESYL